MIKINTKFEQEVPFQVQNYQLQPTLEKGEWGSSILNIKELIEMTTRKRKHWTYIIHI